MAKRSPPFTVHAYSVNRWDAPYDPTDRWIDARTEKEALEQAERIKGDPEIAGKWVSVARRGETFALWRPEGGNWILQMWNPARRRPSKRR